MVNEPFDLEYWKTVFPIDRLHEIFPDYPYLNDLGDVDVTSPFHLVVNEYLREQNPVSQQKEPNPVDLFVWAYGEPSQREVTKIGGLPYFPASRPWPQSVEGEPLEFMAQICFKDSFDICGVLPGDVLLIFAKPNGTIFYDSVFTDDSSVFHFEWVSMGDFPLVLPTHLPPSRLNILPCYGAIYRTIEPIAGTKIGGVPSWIQEEVSVPGRFLFQLHSIAPESLLPYPFINVAARPVLPKTDQLQFYDSWSVLGIPLCWGDLGQVYFFLDGDELHWVAQCS
jgi:hypothetical protein